MIEINIKINHYSTGVWRITRQTTSKTSKMATSLEDITSLRLWKGIMAEFLGTMLLVLVGCGSVVNINDAKAGACDESRVVQVALTFGLGVATIVWSIGHVSGGHINPAVTAAMLATRKISIAKAVFYLIFQVIFLLNNYFQINNQLIEQAVYMWYRYIFNKMCICGIRAYCI